MLTKNLAYNAHGTIDMEIEHPVYGWVPFTASPNDSEKSGRDLYAAAIAGDLGAIAAYVAPVLSASEQRAAIQAQIDALERTQLMPRLTREVTLVLLVTTAAGQGVSEPALYAANIGYKKLKDFEAQIVALRDQMAAIA